MWSAVFASQALIATLSALTLGAFAVGSIVAGKMAMDSMNDTLPSKGDSGSGGQTVYNDNRSYRVEGGGNMDYATQKGVQREIERASEGDSASNYPDIELGSNESNSDSTK